MFGGKMNITKTPARPAPARSKSTVKATRPTVTATASTDPTANPSKKLSPEERLARFNALYKSVSEHIGKNPVKTTTQVRTSAWTHLFDLATSNKQMEKVTKLFPQWRDSGRAWSPQVAENFVRA